MRLSRRLHLRLLAATAAVVFLAGCAAAQPEAIEAIDEPSPTPTSSPTPVPTFGQCPTTPIEVFIDYELEQVAGGVQVAATTNLPDGAELMTSFFRETPNYFGQDVQVVQGGRTMAGPFADDGMPLIGGYELSITLPISPTQPDQTQQCIGPHGENLSGPLVQTDEFGERWVVLDVPVVFG